MHAPASASGSSCCRSASCWRCTRRPGTTPPRTSRRRRTRRRPRRPRASGDRSFWSGVIGWFVLLAFTVRRHRRRRPSTTRGAASSRASSPRARSTLGGEAVILISRPSGSSSAAWRADQRSRTWYAFSRDRGDARAGGSSEPGNSAKGVPVNAVIGGCPGRAPDRHPGAVREETTSRSRSSRVTVDRTIGLYIAYMIPVYLRLARGRLLRAGPVEPRQQVQVGEPLAMVFVVLVVIILVPALTRPAGAVERRLRLERVQLHAAGRRSVLPAHLRRLVPAWRQQALHGAGAARSTFDEKDEESTTPDSTPPAAPVLHAARRAQEGGQGRHRRHGAAHHRRHGGPPAGQAADGLPLPRRGGRDTPPRAATTCSPWTWTWTRCPATRCPRGRAATATS